MIGERPFVSRDKAATSGRWRSCPSRVLAQPAPTADPDLCPAPASSAGRIDISARLIWLFEVRWVYDVGGHRAAPGQDHRRRGVTPAAPGTDDRQGASPATAGFGEGAVAEKGYEATSVEEIAHRAHVSKPVVYEHFGGKEASTRSSSTGRCMRCWT